MIKLKGLKKKIMKPLPGITNLRIIGFEIKCDFMPIIKNVHLYNVSAFLKHHTGLKDILRGQDLALGHIALFLTLPNCLLVRE